MRAKRPPPVPRPAGHGVPESTRQTTVIEVIDGDTIHLARLGSSRLIGVDTPEVYGQAECYGRQASSFTNRWLAPGTTVYYLRGAEPADRYGRDLVYVWLRGGTFYNALLVKQGYAVTLTIAPNDRYAELLRRVARAARRANRGLWSPSACAGNPDQPVRSGVIGNGNRGATSGAAGDRDCADFSSQGAAQRYFDARGGPARDPDYLDADNDGVACEELP